MGDSLSTMQCLGHVCAFYTFFLMSLVSKVGFWRFEKCLQQPNNTGAMELVKYLYFAHFLHGFAICSSQISSFGGSFRRTVGGLVSVLEVSWGPISIQPSGTRQPVLNICCFVIDSEVMWSPTTVQVGIQGLQSAHIG